MQDMGINPFEFHTKWGQVCGKNSKWFQTSGKKVEQHVLSQPVTQKYMRKRYFCEVSQGRPLSKIRETRIWRANPGWCYTEVRACPVAAYACEIWHSETFFTISSLIMVRFSKFKNDLDAESILFSVRPSIFWYLEGHDSVFVYM